MAALIGAMFVTLGPARAATGDLSGSTNRGVCADSAGTLVVDGITYEKSATELTEPIPCPDGAVVGDHVIITATEGAPDVAIQQPIFLLTLSDSDGVVKAGGPDVTATPAVFFANANKTLTVKDDSFTVSGSLALYSQGGVENGDDRTARAVDTTHTTWDGAATTANTKTIATPEGTPNGKHTVSLKFLYDHDGDGAGSDPTDPREFTASAVIEVGDRGSEAGEVTIALSYDTPEDVTTAKVELTQETGSAPADGADSDIRVRINTRNTLGNIANKVGLSSIIVTAGGGTIDLRAMRSSGADLGTIAGATGGANTATVTGAQVDAVAGSTADLYALITKTNNKPGTVAVSATVVGTDGSVATTSEALVLSFTGSGNSLTLGTPKGAAPGTQTEFSIDVVDSAGNEVSSVKTDYSFAVKDSDGTPVTNRAVIKVEQSTVGSSTDTILDNNPLAAAGLVTIGATAKPGVYTIETSIRGLSSSKETTTLVVAGRAEVVELAADPDTGDAAEHDVIKVTATVTDKNGAAVADGTLVEFSVLGSSLSAIGPGHSPIMTRTDKQVVVTRPATATTEAETKTVEVKVTEGGAATKDGMVSVSYVVTGAGTAVVDATTGSVNDVLRITTTDSAADDAAAEEEPEVVSLDCLSSLTGFSSYTCSVGSSASELFGLLDGRGATAIHLWNGSMWVRYAVVDGSEIPGSSDFTVTEDDILYISN